MNSIAASPQNICVSLQHKGITNKKRGQALGSAASLVEEQFEIKKMQYERKRAENYCHHRHDD